VPTAVATAADPAGRRRFVGIIIGLLQVNFDATVRNVALPRIGDDLHSSAATLPWTADAYTVDVSGLLLAAGALADRLGSGRVSRGALMTLADFSMLCALARTPERWMNSSSRTCAARPWSCSRGPRLGLATVTLGGRASEER
jgi:MFS family permease